MQSGREWHFHTHAYKWQLLSFDPLSSRPISLPRALELTGIELAREFAFSAPLTFRTVLVSN